MDAIFLPHSRFSLLEKKLSLLKLSPIKSDGRSEWRCCRLWRRSWGRWLSCRRGCRWWSRRWPGSRHWCIDCFDGQVHHNQQCQVKLAKIHPKVQVWSLLQNTRNDKNLNITGSIRLQVWSSSNLNQTLNYWNNFSDRWYYRNGNTYNLVRQGQFFLRASENTWIWKLKRQRGLSYVLLASYWKKDFFLPGPQLCPNPPNTP